MASILKVTEITTPDGTGNITVSRPLTGGTGVKGGDIASASPLVIDTDGDYFDVTGTTGFAAMTVAADRQFTLQFDGALTMTHHATNLDLPGEANITTAAGDVAVFQSTGANTVQCINYMRADGTGIAGGGDFSDGGDAGGAARTLGNTDAYDLAFETNNVEQLQIEGDAGAGIITTPNQSGCYVDKSDGAQAITTGTITKIEWGAEEYDIQNEFDSSTNFRFTATNAGKYLVQASWYGNFDDAINQQHYVFINDAEDMFNNGASSEASQWMSTRVSGVIAMAAGDYVDVRAYHNKGSNENLSAAKGVSWLRISKIA